jgi:DNA excision repair protein ERCC-1
MTRATPDQLQNLPGFGQVKVKNIRNAFEKPFRNQATSSIAVSLSQKQASGSARSNPPSTSRTTRPASPEWDIEDDGAPLPDQDDDVEVVESSSINRVFDVDLDLT